MADQVRQDVPGYKVITYAIMDLINGYPGLTSGERVSFSLLAEDRGKAVFPTSGAVIDRERRDILGNVVQTCQYPFYVVYRSGSLTEKRKGAVKEWLDDLGRWLEGQPVTIGETTYTLASLPELTGGREFTEIRRNSPTTLNQINDNGTEDWMIAITARYKYKFKRRR